MDFLEPRLRFPASMVGVRGTPNVTLTYAQSVLGAKCVNILVSQDILRISYRFVQVSANELRHVEAQRLEKNSGSCTNTGRPMNSKSSLNQCKSVHEFFFDSYHCKVKGLDGCICGPIASERQLISGEASWKASFWSEVVSSCLWGGSESHVNTGERNKRCIAAVHKFPGKGTRSSSFHVVLWTLELWIWD